MEYIYHVDYEKYLINCQNEDCEKGQYLIFQLKYF